MRETKLVLNYSSYTVIAMGFWDPWDNRESTSEAWKWDSNNVFSLSCYI